MLLHMLPKSNTGSTKGDKYTENQTKIAQCLELLTREECSAIFSARTTMLNVNGNYHIAGTHTNTAEHVATKRKHRNIY